MSRAERDEEREYRIMMEAVVDAYDEIERAMGWYYYLDDKIHFPFKARCITEEPIVPLKVGEEVEVLEMAPEDDCMHDMFVIVKVNWTDRTFGAPLSQLTPVAVDDQTQEAIEDWHYWTGRGYEF